MAGLSCYVQKLASHLATLVENSNRKMATSMDEIETTLTSTCFFDHGKAAARSTGLNDISETDSSLVIFWSDQSKTQNGLI